VLERLDGWMGGWVDGRMGWMMDEIGEYDPLQGMLPV